MALIGRIRGNKHFDGIWINWTWPEVSKRWGRMAMLSLWNRSVSGEARATTGQRCRASRSPPLARCSPC